MILISGQNMGAALKLLDMIENCPDINYCVWGKPQVSVDQDCSFLGRRCPLIYLRRAVEKESPAFWGLYLEISRHNSVMHDYTMIELEGDPGQKQETRKQFKELSLFRYVSLLGLFSLYSANEGVIPYISKELIGRTTRTFSLESTLDQIRKVNSHWINYLEVFFNNAEDGKEYKFFFYLLVEVFLRAVERDNEFVDPLSQGEGTQFFKEIAEYIKPR